MNTEILDVTLRDGSYELDFQFTQDDVREIGSALQTAGVKYIELGHGQGLNASSPQHGVAKCSDEEYLVAANECLSNSKFGFFCIPDIARLQDIDLLSRYGGSFVRIGCNTNIPEVTNSMGYIEHAKELGLMVSANYMKTYVAEAREFAECVRLSHKAGADYLVIVDSAGCMFPEDIKQYYDIIKNETHGEAGVGFHGHDNLGLAVHNTLYAASIGCEMIDTSLQSLGRGAGNASTEQVIAILQKRYGCTDYALANLMAFSEQYIRPRVKFKGVSGLDTYCGIAGFHSGYMNSVRKFAAQYSVSPYDLIVEYCKIDRVLMNEKELEKIAVKLSHGTEG